MTELEKALEALVRRLIDEKLETTTIHVQREVIVVDPRRLYSVKSAAELLEVSRPYVYDRINDGSLAVVELGTGRAKQRISVAELQRFIDARTFPPRSEPSSR